MAQWVRIQQMNSQVIGQIQKLYSEALFPIEVRHFFSQWIEEQPWNNLDKNEESHNGIALQLLNDLLVQLKEKRFELQEEQFFPIKLKFQEAENNFTQFYGHNPFGFVDTVKRLLETELNLMQADQTPAVQDVQMNGHVVDSRVDEITQQLELLKRTTTETEADCQQLQANQESFIIEYQDSTKISNQLKQIDMQTEKTVEHRRREESLKKQKEEVEANLIQKAQELLQLRIVIANQYNDTVSKIDSIQKTVLDDELIKWKHQQQHSGNGEKCEGGLDQLQKWCEELADLNWKNRQQIQRCRQLQAQLPIELPPGQIDLLPNLSESVTGLLSTLVTSTFIVSCQPPQVLKKDSRFSASVRLLVGGKLNVYMTPPTVKATIISEKQAQDLLKNDVKAKNESSGEILNNNGTMDFQQQTSKLSITFRNMQLKRIKRADRKNNEAVTEEKFCILFQSDFKVGGNELVFQTLSLPVVVIVHGNQECNAHATILWDNAFSEPCRIPFHVPDQVTWKQLKAQLDIKFKAITGRGLTEDHLNYLATKLFDGQMPVNEDFSSCLVSWALFNKEPVKGRNFTFWEWLYAVAKLTKEHLKEPWNDGSVIGFISKCQAQEWLFTKPNGTFLLRFSDSEPGGITIAWVDDKANGKLEVWNLKPFGAKDFTIRSLADRIKDLGNLVYLYPDIPKENAFGKYFSSNPEQSSQSKDGYIKPNLMTVIPDRYNSQPMNPDNPQTPQIMEPFSPATSTTTFDRSPGSVFTQQSQDEQMNCDLEEFCLFPTDYTPEDIEHINVNELLYQGT